MSQRPSCYFREQSPFFTDVSDSPNEKRQQWLNEVEKWIFPHVEKKSWRASRHDLHLRRWNITISFMYLLKVTHWQSQRVSWCLDRAWGRVRFMSDGALLCHGSTFCARSKGAVSIFRSTLTVTSTEFPGKFWSFLSITNPIGMKEKAFLLMVKQTWQAWLLLFTVIQAFSWPPLWKNKTHFLMRLVWKVQANNNNTNTQRLHWEMLDYCTNSGFGLNEFFT